MSRDSFASRISKLEKVAPTSAPQSKRPARRGGGVLGRLAFALFLIIGIAARILTNIALEDEFTPEALYYPQVMGFAAGFHIFMLGGGLIALFTFRRWPVFARAVFGAIVGYGIGSVMMLAIN